MTIEMTATDISEPERVNPRQNNFKISRLGSSQ